MGVDTKMFVTASSDKANLIGKAVADRLTKYFRKVHDDAYNKELANGETYTSKMHYMTTKGRLLTSVSVEAVTSDFELFKFNFKLNGDVRNLIMFITCHNDYSDVYKGDKIIFNLGCWGESVTIMKIVGEALTDFGDVYFTKNDCEDEFENITEILKQRKKLAEFLV